MTARIGVFRELFVDGLTVSAGILEGDVREVLIAEAHRWAADCIVFGSQPGDHSEGFLDNGICAAMTANTECSLEVVR
jgi:nucleotide-binding universal stress UspA family protein